MRLLVDANLSPRIAARLRGDGHDAHVNEVGLLAADDPTILMYAAAEARVIISADSDFAMLLAVAGHHEPSLILLRSADHLTPDQQAALLRANLDTVGPDLASGAVVTISRGHLRSRALPVQRSN